MKHSEINAMSNREILARVRIAGTKFDRRVKVTKEMDAKMKSMYADGITLQKIADRFGVAVSTVLRHVDHDYWESRRHDGGKNRTSKISSKELAEYKRSLLLRGCKVEVLEK